MNANTRKWAFMLGCIPARLLLVVLARGDIIPNKYMNLFGFLLFCIAVGMLYLYFTNGRQHAYESGGYTWWRHLRLIHGLLYLASAIYIYKKHYDVAWMPLLADVIIGIAYYWAK